MTAFAGFDGTYEFMAGGSFKRLFVDEEAESLVYVPKKGDTVGEKLRQVLAWEHNIERLREQDVELPFDRHSIVLTEYEGGTTPVLQVDYEEEVRRGMDLPEDEEEKYREDWEEYQQVVEELREEGELAMVAMDALKTGGRNMGAHPEKGAVVIDCGEVYEFENDTEKVTGEHMTADAFYEDHGIDERACSVLEALGGGEDG